MTRVERCRTAMDRQRRALSPVVVGMLAVLALAGSVRCSGPPRGQVLIIGIDGAELDRMRPLLADGRMPNLSRLMGDGVSGDLGYPSTVQLDDGSLVTVWYENMSGSPNAVLRQARWSLEG